MSWAWAMPFSLHSSLASPRDTTSPKKGADSSPRRWRGFGVGCLLCELSPGIDGRGLPALLYILPVMVLAVLATAAVDGDDVFNL